MAAHAVDRAGGCRAAAPRSAALMQSVWRRSRARRPPGRMRVALGDGYFELAASVRPGARLHGVRRSARELRRFRRSARSETKATIRSRSAGCRLGARNMHACARHYDEVENITLLLRKQEIPVIEISDSSPNVRYGSWSCKNTIPGKSVRRPDRFGLRPRSQPSAAWSRRCS